MTRQDRPRRAPPRTQAGPKARFNPRKKSGPSRESEPREAEGGAERLQKVLAAAGVGSRRSCEELIRDGRVEVDKKVVSELGTKVDPLLHEIRVDGEALQRPERVYFAVNKPMGVVCTNNDPSGRPRVVDLLPTQERVFTVGRLDRGSEGLILVTNDGEFANRITHPRYGVQKTYLVRVAGNPDEKDLSRLRKGVYIAEGVCRVDRLTVKGRHKQSTDMVIVLSEGRNREIRRILAAVGHKVMRLRRIAVGGLRLGDLPIGTWRKLLPKEIESLLGEAKAKWRERKKSGKPPASGESEPQLKRETLVADQDALLNPAAPRVPPPASLSMADLLPSDDDDDGNAVLEADDFADEFPAEGSDDDMVEITADADEDDETGPGTLGDVIDYQADEDFAALGSAQLHRGRRPARDDRPRHANGPRQDGRRPSGRPPAGPGPGGSRGFKPKTDGGRPAYGDRRPDRRPEGAREAAGGEDRRPARPFARKPGGKPAGKFTPRPGGKYERREETRGGETSGTGRPPRPYGRKPEGGTGGKPGRRYPGKPAVGGRPEGPGDRPAAGGRGRSFGRKPDGAGGAKSGRPAGGKPRGKFGGKSGAKFGGRPAAGLGGKSGGKFGAKKNFRPKGKGRP